MHDPRTFWLTTTNIALGLALLLLILGAATGGLWDAVRKRKRRHALWHEIDREMRRMFHGSGKI